MELEEPDDEEWKKWNYTTTSASSKYYLYPKSDGNNNSDGKVCWVLERGFNIGKKILVAGLVASSAPIVVPPLVVASAIGIAVSMPYAFFLASHACTENLMSRLLPRPTITHHDPNNKLILDVIGMDTEKKEEFIECEADREIGMVGGVEHVNSDEKDVTLGSDYGQEVVVEKEEEEEENAEPEMIDGLKVGDEKEDEGIMEGNEVTEMHDDDVVKIGDEKDDEGTMEGNAEAQMDEFGDEKEDEGIIEGNAEPQLLDDDVKLGNEKEDEGVMEGNEVKQIHDDDVKIGDEKVDEGTMEGNAVPQMLEIGDEKEDEGIIEGNADSQVHEDDVKLGDEIEDEIEDDRIMEGDLISGEELVSGRHGVVITIEGLDDENGDDDIEEFKAPFEVTTVSVEEFGDEALEGDIEEEELQRETKGLLEKIRDEGRNDSGGEFVYGSTNENYHENGPVVENFEVPHNDNQSCIIIEGGEGDAREEEDRRAYKEMLESINDENKDTIYAEVESAEPVIGMLEEKVVDDKNDSQTEMAEHSEQLDGGSFQLETIPAEPVGELVIEEDYSDPVSEDSSKVTGEKIDTDIVVKEEPKPVLDGATVTQEGKLDNNISDSGNQESQLREHNITMDSSDADATKVAIERGFDLSDEKKSDPDADAYTIDLHEESSTVVVDGNTSPTEAPVSAAAQELKPSECSSGKDVMCPSPEAAFDEESIWKQIHVIRKIIGYESTAQASCADELKALYIFTGVEPPNFLNENSDDPAEINEKLHFLMSIVGVQ